jgi:hypothetical protein
MELAKETVEIIERGAYVSADAGPTLPHADVVLAVSLSADGHTALSGSADKTACLWTVAHAIAGDPEQIALWAQVRTGFELDPHGNPRPRR